MRGKNFKNMSRRKYKKRIQEQNATVIKPDVKVNVEIDYDKLAEAIVKAEKKTEENDDKEIKSVLWLQRKGAAILYRLLAFSGFAFFALGAIALIIAAIGWQWVPFITVFSNILAIFTIALLLFAVVVVSMMLWTSSDQVEKVKDKQMLMSLSSGLIGFIALIAAIVAIFVK